MSATSCGGPLAATLAAALLMLPSPAFAACPIELAIYGDRDDVASVEFRPRPEGAAITNQFRVIMHEKGVAFDGVVMWSAEVERPNGIVMHQCPEGDVTGDELAACTLWQGVIYAVGADGAIDLLPQQGGDAPPRIVLSDLAYSMNVAPAFERSGLTKLPFDAFEMKGCQE